MDLQTPLDHVSTTADYQRILEENENVMICCGRMGPMCIPVYAIMDKLRNEYINVAFYDMNFDIPVAMETIRPLPECRSFMGLPFTVYYKNGKVVQATSSIQNEDQVRQILDSFTK